MSAKGHLLEICDLNVTYAGDVHAVRAADIVVPAKGRVGLVGESGSGKSTIAQAILGLLPASTEVTGTISYRGVDLLTATQEERRRIRWNGISMIFQNSMTAFNPVRRVGTQIEDAIQFHSGVGRAEARTQVTDLFETVGLDPRRTRSYPHELSGGMRQRAMIALALSCHPSVVIADEPTTALDVVMQRKVLDLLSRLQREQDLALVLVSHDLAVVAETVDHVYVMSDGVIVEEGLVAEVLLAPKHEYTKSLINSYRALEVSRTDAVKEGGRG